MTKEEAKHLSDVLKAYSEDKAIEIKVNNKWVLYDLANKYQMGTPLRIKPEPKLRPYKSAEEFLKAQKEHGPYIKGYFHEKVYSIPVSVGPNAIEYIIRNCLDSAVAGVIEYSQLINCIWQDGTPCGILEE